jgi:hypothetical protein
VVGFARNTASFDVFYWLQVTNYGVRYVLFDSPPSGSNHIDVWDLCLHVQMASPNVFRSNAWRLRVLLIPRKGFVSITALLLAAG